jgi:DNA repair photolyase
VTPNPANRFERITMELDASIAADDPAPRTQFFKDSTRSIIAHNTSPDVGFELSINPYRGCEHGCVYCYARPTHEYLGLSAGLDFKSKILIKQDAPELLRTALSSSRWQPKPLALSGVTDPYQPVERTARVTRGCLEVLAEFRHPVVVVTKNFLVTRDVDLLADLASHGASKVAISITTLDPVPQRSMEPRTSSPVRRLDAIEQLARAGVPVAVFLAPLIPGLNEHEIPAILDAAAERGASEASCVPLRLPHGVKEIFLDWLDRHVPDRKDKVVNQILAMRGGRLNDPRLGSRMKGQGPLAKQVLQFFQVARRKAGLDGPRAELSSNAFRRPGDVIQLTLDC